MTREEFGLIYEGGGFSKTINFLRKRNLDPIAAEEIAQYAWMRGWEKRDQVKAALTPWVIGIAINKHLGIIRKNRLSNGTKAPDPACTISTKSLEVEEMLGMCKPKYRRLLEQRYLEELSYEELGEMYNTTPKNMRIRVLRAKRHLQFQIKRKRRIKK